MRLLIEFRKTLISGLLSTVATSLLQPVVNVWYCAYGLGVRQLTVQNNPCSNTCENLAVKSVISYNSV